MNSRLISYPYYTKDTTAGENPGFKHLDLNVPRLLSESRSINIVQSSVSADDEAEDGCTILVPGFHRNIREWWSRVETRGKGALRIVWLANQSGIHIGPRSLHSEPGPAPQPVVLTNKTLSRSSHCTLSHASPLACDICTDQTHDIWAFLSPHTKYTLPVSRRFLPRMRTKSIRSYAKRRCAYQSVLAPHCAREYL